MQQYAVGVDSVAIVVSPDMTWLPTSLNHKVRRLQVALFADTTPTNDGNQGLTGVTGSTALCKTWDDFFIAHIRHFNHRRSIRSLICRTFFAQSEIQHQEHSTASTTIS